MTFEKLQKNIIKWAKDKNLIDSLYRKAQFIKVVEELGELAEAILKDNEEAIIDGIGDTLVTLIILAEQHKLDVVSCLASAYEEIKDREGETVNGTFIKKQVKV